MPKCCIYHIEDNPADLRIISLALRSHGVGIEIHEAADGEDAMRLLTEADSGRACIPSILVVDINIPKLSGLDVVAHAKKMPRLRNIPVAFLTSSDDPADQERCQILGADAYLRKPMNLNDFIALGRSLLEIASMHRDDCKPS